MAMIFVVNGSLNVAAGGSAVFTAADGDRENVSMIFTEQYHKRW